jgi:hypothetical protein
MVTTIQVFRFVRSYQLFGVVQFNLMLDSCGLFMALFIFPN